ncbi:MAG: glycosyltransferase family 4 protein [Candidatus Hydrogenedentes bacterium]|nr:glycosyltransferase family 4 protein [Candidatus Hydrogenedentota bacterium]
MRILILSFYHPPDVGPGAFRTAGLVEALRNRLSNADEIEVLTTQPNRFEGMLANAASEEANANVVIRRCPLPRVQAGVAGRTRLFNAYALHVRRWTAGRSFDVVYASSARMLTAWLGAVVARRTGAQLYVDFRDILANDMFALYPHTALFFNPMLRAVENFVAGRAARINVVSAGFAPYFRSRWKDLLCDEVPNGIDGEVLAFNYSAQRRTGASTRTILYAGAIGHCQALHRIVPPLADALRETHRFVLVGNGSARRHIERAVTGMPNVSIVDPMPRAELLFHYALSDVLFLHLHEHDAFRMVLPSKLIEYAATGKPILAGVAGYPADFARREIPGVALFDPYDVPGALRALGKIEMKSVSRSDFIAAFDRGLLMEKLALCVLSVTAEPARA